MKVFWQKVAAVGFLLFVLLGLAGLARAFSRDDAELPTFAVPNPSELSNYVSSADNSSGARLANNFKQLGLAGQPLPLLWDAPDLAKVQVFEKTARLAVGTTDFDADERRVRSALAEAKATTFSEVGSGVAPGRALVLGIAVPPERFDALHAALARVGTLVSNGVQQVDRTGELRKLHAQRASLKKHQDALSKLRDGDKLTVEEALKLEQKIYEAEKEGQALGVQLGDLLAKEPSYNIFLTLHEARPGSRQDRGFTATRRLGDALLWTAGWWTAAALALGLVAGTYFSVRSLRTPRA